MLRFEALLKKLLIGGLLGCSAALAAGAVGLLPFAETVELKTYDLRVQLTAHPATARHDIVLVDIDERSIRALEPVVGRWPWPRVIHAGLVDYLSRAPARVVAIDVLFTDRDRTTSFRIGESSWSGAESDQALVDSTGRAGNVIYAADATYGGTEGPSTPAAASIPLFALDDSFEERPVLAPPFEELAAASRGIGHNYFVLDADGPLRSLVPFVRVGGRFVPSLGVAAALAATGVKPEEVRLENGELRLGQQRMALRAIQRAVFSGDTGSRTSERALIRFTGPALLPDGKTPTYRTFSFYDLFYSQQQLLADQKPLVDPAAFRDAVVIVGSSAAGLHDVFSVPLGSTGKMTGMQIHANVVDGVLSSRFIRRLGAGAALGAALACGLIVGIVAVFLSPWTTAAATALVSALFAWLSLALFNRDIWLDAFQPLLALALVLFGGVTYQYVDEGQEKRRIKKLFSRYVAPDVFNQLMTDPSRASLGGKRRDMTVLFSDIRGFTTFSEQGRPEDIVTQLNEYFSRMVDVLFRHQGTLDKFVGDMVMALFGAPLEDPDHADHALRAALTMVNELADLNRQWAAQGRPALDIGIGINSGEMVAGNIGSDTIMSYTVIGDAVNLGARLESLNKEYGTRIIISAQTARRLKGRYDLRPLGTVVVKGKSEAVAIFEVKPGEPT